MIMEYIVLDIYKKLDSDYNAAVSLNSDKQIPEEVEREILGFTWIMGGLKHTKSEGMGLTPDVDNLYAYVIYVEPIPDMSDAEKETLSHYVTEEGKRVYYCGFGKFDIEINSKIGPPSKPSLTHHKIKSHGEDKPSPTEIDEGELFEIIKNKKLIFYTGAGISVAAGTPDMRALEAFLGIDMEKQLDDFTKMLMFSPDTVKQKLIELQDSFFERTTPAHNALTELQKEFGFRIATENLDTLGETAGMALIKRQQIETQITDQELMETDYIVTVGLHSDDSGLMYRFRQLNPTGKFIALNIEPPVYLEKYDLYLEGDCQVTLPSLAFRLTKQKIAHKKNN